MMDKLNVLYQSNDYYAVVTGVSITSLLENNKDIFEINIYILDDSISEANKDKLVSLCASYGRKISFVDTIQILKQLKDLKVTPYKNTYTTYFKLMAFKNLDITTDRILQLDGDTIINSSLKYLCNLDISDYVGAAVYDCMMNKNKGLIGIPETDKYFNCGVLLINQQKWRELDCETQIINHLKSVRNGYFTVDQDIINVLFRNQIKTLNITYNFNSGFYIYGIKESLKMYDLKESYYYSYEEISNVLKKPIINHCMGAMTGRPWEKNNVHPQNELFDKYRALSPWRDFVKVTVNRSIMFRIQKILYLLLPISIYIPIHKYVQNQFYKKMNKMAQKNKL